MSRYIPPRITDKGLRNHLDITKSSHDGYGYDDFVKMRQRGVNPANMARLFMVHYKTMKNWIEIYKQENSEKVENGRTI